MKLRRLQNVKFVSSEYTSIVDFAWSVAKTYRDFCGDNEEVDLLEILLRHFLSR